MADYLKKTLAEYINDLGARQITPGGGSAAALTGACGAGLNLMILNYSIKPEEAKTASTELLSAKVKQEESLNNLSHLIDEDCEAISSLMKALKENQPAEKDYMQAAEVPLKICAECAESMAITLYLVEHANQNLASDTGCAAHMLKAAFYSARLNVHINLRYIGDSSFVKEAEKAVATFQEEVNSACKAITERLGNAMSSEM